MVDWMPLFREGLLLKIYIMKVKIRFKCTKEKKMYEVGDEYTGKRKDLKALLEDKQHPKTKKVATETKKK